MAKEITDLVEATVLNDADLILARQGSEDKKALVSTLIDKVNLGLPVADSSNKGIVDKELILQLLLLVDGSGSGLDADLLDGEQGSFYRNADNLNAGTVPTSRLPSATTTQKGIVQKATTIEAETGVIDKYPDAAGVLAAISANTSTGRFAGDYDILLPLGVYTSGTYTIPGGRSWTDYDLIEMSASPTPTSSITGLSGIITKEHMAADPNSWVLSLTSQSSNYVNLTAISSTQFTISRGSDDTARMIIGYRKVGVA